MLGYDNLESGRERSLYRRMAEGIASRDALLSFSASDEPLLPGVIRAVVRDSPQFFWFDGRVSVKRENDILILKPRYSYDAPFIEQAAATIDRFGGELRSYADGTDMNKAKAVFDLLLSHIAYCGDSGGQNVVNALIERRAVCKGMSKAYQYLLSGLGVFVTSLTGELRGSRHQWNLVRVNGVYYHVDLSLSYPAFDFLFPEALANDRYRTFLFSDRFLAGLGVKEDRDVRRPPCTLSYQEESK